MTIKELLQKNKKQFSYYILGVILVTPSSLMITFAIANAFNIFESTGSKDFTITILVSFALGLSPIILQLISRYLRIGFMRDILAQVRIMAYDKLLATTTEEFSKESKETYQSRLTSDINLFENDFFLSLLNIAYSFGNFILGTIVLIFISPLVSLITIFATIVLFFLSKYYEKPSLEKRNNVIKQNGIYHKVLSNVLRGLETIKLSRVEGKFKEKFYSEVYDLEKTKKEMIFINEKQASIMESLSGFFQLSSYIYAAYLFSKGLIPLSQMVIVLNLVGQLIWSMNSGFSFINRFKTSVSIYNKITEYSREDRKSEKLNLENEILIDNLSFAYDNNIVLDNLSFKINKNNAVLIYGPSGTGKTTLLDCISKNLSDYKGKILYDSKNLKFINDDSFWDKVAYARQEHFIFNDSIRNNIVLTKAFDRNKFRTILKDLALDDWINSLSEKENYILKNNGSNISGGQRQRISIARELYQDKEIMIFDEPSASLDDETANKVYDTILKQDKTVIFVSHRHLDYLENKFDKSLNLEKGRN